MTQISIDTQNSLPMMLAKLNSRLALELNAALEKFDLSGAQWQVLAALIYERCDSPGAISSLLGSDGAAVTRHLDTLERKGFAERVRSQTDRRAVKLEATAKGQEIAPRALTAAAEVERRMLDRLEAGDRERLKELLGGMLMEKAMVATTLEDWERS